jgi:hypothetical protein
MANGFTEGEVQIVVMGSRVAKRTSRGRPTFVGEQHRKKPNMSFGRRTENFQCKIPH